MKNAGHVAGKTIFTIVIVSLTFWAAGYALIFGDQGNSLIGWGQYFLFDMRIVPDGVSVAPTVMFIFQPAFAAISMSVAWGGFTERAQAIRIFDFRSSFFFARVSGCGALDLRRWMACRTRKQDFAGSTVVHLTGAMAALAATLLLKPRIGKYLKNGQVNQVQGIIRCTLRWGS